MNSIHVAGAGFAIIQRKFDFTRLAESALLDDFEIVTRVHPAAAESSTSDLTSLQSHLLAAAADHRSSHSTPNDTQTPRRSACYLEPVSKHMYVSLTGIKLENGIIIRNIITRYTFTARRSYVSMVLVVVILSVCQSVPACVCHTRALYETTRTHCRYFDTIILIF